MKPTVLHLALLAALAALSACAHLGSTSQVRPSSLGLEMHIQELRATWAKYQVSYSGEIFNPSALIFIPHDRADRLKLHQGWTRVKDESVLSDLLRRLKDFYDHHVRLWALAAPEDPETGQREFLGYIYTPAYASLRPADQPGTYFLGEVEEQFTSIYYGGDGEIQDSFANTPN